MQTVAERVNQLSRLGKEHLTLTPPLPRATKMETNEHCNLDCSFCFRGSVRAGTALQKMSRDTQTAVMGRLHEAGIEELGLFLWNEPCTDRALPETIRRAKEIGFRWVFITSNGTLADQDFVRECIEAGLDSLKFSVNQKDPQEFHELTGARGELFQRMLANIRAARTARDDVQARTGHHCRLTASWIHLHDRRQAEMQPILDEVARSVDDVYALASYNIEEGQLSEEQIAAGWTVAIGNPGTYARPHPPIPCHILFKFPVIDARGNVSACAFNHGQRSSEFVVGNVLERDLATLWHGPRIQELRAAHLEAWRKRDLAPILDTPCRACLTAPRGLSGLLPGQKAFLELEEGAKV